MTSYRRNIVVGITMLGALVILGWMIMQFGDRPAKLFAPETMPVTIITERADGIAEGSVVGYRGVGVGRVQSVRRSEDNIHVVIECLIDVTPPLPDNVEGLIRSQFFGGSGILSLVLTGPEPVGVLKKGKTLHAHFVGLDVVPPEFAQLATDLRLTSQQFRDSNIVAHLDEQVQRAGKILDSVDKIVSDPKLRDDIKGAVSNIRSASENASRLTAKLEQTTDHVNQAVGDVRGTLAKTNTSIDTLTHQTSDRMEQLANTLANLESITNKIDKGQGTAGALVNDPKLYQSLVDTSRELNTTISDLKRLVEQWEQEGMSFKLK